MADIPPAAEGTPALVTGATGFLGSRLAAGLVKSGLRVRALVRPSSDLSRLEHLPVELVRGDLCSPPGLAAAVSGQRLVFHCAARVSDWGSRADFHRANVEGTRHLAEACAVARVQRLVHVSSLTVLGLPRDGRIVDETEPVVSRPEDLYTESKIAAERVVLDLVSRGLAATIVRPAAIWGPGESYQLPRLERLLRARLVPLIGGGANRVALSHVENLAGGIISAALCPEAAGEIYHLTDGEELTARELLLGLAHAFGLPAPWLSLPYRPLLALGALSEALAKAVDRSTGPPLTRYAVRVLASDCRYEIAKARRQLGYSPTVTFRTGIEELASRRPLSMSTGKTNML